MFYRDTADWWYELDQSVYGTPGSAELAYLEGLLTKLQECIHIFRQDSLFIPSQLILSRWIKVAGDEKTDLDMNEQYVDVDEQTGSRLDKLIMNKILAQQGTDTAIRPADIALRGWTHLADAHGEARQHHDIVRIDTQFMSGGIVQIKVAGDAWLPWSFDGKLENLAYRRNADLLERALMKTERSFKVEPIFDDASDFCMIDRYRLSNFRDVDDEVIGIDARGQFL